MPRKHFYKIIAIIHHHRHKQAIWTSGIYQVINRLLSKLGYSISLAKILNTSMPTLHSHSYMDKS